MTKLFRCDGCGCVCNEFDVNVTVPLNENRNWSHFGDGSSIRHYCPDCTDKIQEYLEKLKDATGDK